MKFQVASSPFPGAFRLVHLDEVNAMGLSIVLKMLTLLRSVSRRHSTLGREVTPVCFSFLDLCNDRLTRDFDDTCPCESAHING